MQEKILIKNGWLADGTGKPKEKADVLIQGDRIIKVGKVEGEAEKVIDANGMIVAPGFIDTHSHSDLVALIQPELLPKIMQGITTEVLGQDGISMAPLPKSYISPWRKNLAGLDGNTDAIDWGYETTENYLKMLEKSRTSTNQCYLLPHGNIRMEAMGLEKRKATKEELEKMKVIVRREMAAGAIGISDGLIYTPCAYSDTEEIIEICKEAVKYHGMYVVHQRSEADDILNSMEEIIRIGRESHIPIHFSHFKVCGRKNWEKIDAMLALLDSCKEEGIQVTFDQYPYVAGSTMLGVILPPWAHDGGTDCLMERLSNDKDREKMRYDMEHGIPGWDNFMDFAGMEQIYITSTAGEKNQDVIGLNLIQLGEKRGKDPYDAVFDLLLEEENAVGMVDFYGTDEHVKRFMLREEMNACTDGLLGGKPHPRAYGAFPRILAEYVRKQKALSLELAISKMTLCAARALNIKERGRIAEGYYADICIFEADKIRDMGTFVEPIQYPEGIAYVIVNGRISVEKGRFTGVRNGYVLRRPDEGRE